MKGVQQAKSMSWTVKTVIVVLCFSLCGAGSFIASTARERSEPQKMNAIPVKNRDLLRRVWIQV
jgi:hypothetical protein